MNINEINTTIHQIGQLVYKLRCVINECILDDQIDIKLLNCSTLDSLSRVIAELEATHYTILTERVHQMEEKETISNHTICYIGNIF